MTYRPWVNAVAASESASAGSAAIDRGTDHGFGHVAAGPLTALDGVDEVIENFDGAIIRAGVEQGGGGLSRPGRPHPRVRERLARLPGLLGIFQVVRVHSIQHGTRNRGRVARAADIYRSTDQRGPTSVRAWGVAGILPLLQQLRASGQVLGDTVGLSITERLRKTRIPRPGSTIQLARRNIRGTRIL